MKLIRLDDHVAISENTEILRVALLHRDLSNDIQWPKSKRIKYCVWVQWNGGSVSYACENYDKALKCMNNIIDVVNKEKRGKK